MSLCGSVILISKMVSMRSLLLLIAYTNVLNAGTTYGPYPPSIQNFTTKSEDEVVPVIAGEMKTIPYPVADIFPPVDQTNVIESEPYQTVKTENVPCHLKLVAENELCPSGKPETGLYYPTKPVNGNESKPALITIPNSYIRAVETDKIRKPSQLLPTTELRENTRPNEYPVIHDSSPIRVQEILPPLSKDELLPHSPLKPQQVTERGTLGESTYMKDPLPLLPANTDVESPPLTHYIDKIRSDSYTNALSNDKNILPVQEQDPIPPLPNRSGEHYHIPDKIVEVIKTEEFHKPLPPLAKVPIRTVALPITEGPYSAAVIATGPFPATASVLKYVPVVHFAEPLPPLKNPVPTNVDTPKTSTLQIPQGPYPANLPLGHPYPPAI